MELLPPHPQHPRLELGHLDFPISTHVLFGIADAAILLSRARLPTDVAWGIALSCDLVDRKQFSLVVISMRVVWLVDVDAVALLSLGVVAFVLFTISVATFVLFTINVAAFVRSTITVLRGISLTSSNLIKSVIMIVSIGSCCDPSRAYLSFSCRIVSRLRRTNRQADAGMAGYLNTSSALRRSSESQSCVSS